MKKCKVKMYGLLAAAFALCMSGCSAVPAYNSAVGFYLDTVVTVSGYADEAVLRSAVDKCGEYEALLSRTVEGSDVWRINHANGQPVEVSDETAELLETALEVCEKSSSALDITIAPCSSLWDFKAESPALPDEKAIAKAAKLVDYTKLKLDGNTVTLPDGMGIDLGAVAKGYIADKIVEYLRTEGVKSAVVNLGGNVALVGGKPDGSAWAIGIQDPNREDGTSAYSISGQDESIVTSGVYQRGFDLGGIRYHHILDAETGYPVQNGLASVTIITESSAIADAMSTACFVMGLREGLSFAQSMGVDAVFIDAEGNMHCTPAIEGRLERAE